MKIATKKGMVYACCSYNTQFNDGLSVLPMQSSTCLYLTIIRQVPVGSEMIDSQRGAQHQVGYNHLISNNHEWNICFIKNRTIFLLKTILLISLCKNNQKTIYMYWAPFVGHGIMAHIPWLLRPIKFLEMHYTRIHFLINHKTIVLNHSITMTTNLNTLYNSLQVSVIFKHCGQARSIASSFLFNFAIDKWPM